MWEETLLLPGTNLTVSNAARLEACPRARSVRCRPKETADGCSYLWPAAVINSLFTSNLCEVASNKALCGTRFHPTLTLSPSLAILWPESRPSSKIYIREGA